MFEAIIKALGLFAIGIISRLGYWGIIAGMAIESACIPLPSEVIMPFSGYLVFKNRLDLWYVSLSGALGCVIGSVIAYIAGAYGGRPFLERYGRYVLISHRDIATADRWFEKYGDRAIFMSRLMPVIRTFISLPAGIARMNFLRFVLYTFLGSLPWCFALTFIGLKLGKNWDTLGRYFHRLDMIIVIGLIAIIMYFIWRHWPGKRR